MNIRKIPKPSLVNILLPIALTLFFAIVPYLMGFDMMAELGVLAIIGNFVGKLKKPKGIITVTIICVSIGVAVISLGIMIPAMQYQSIIHFGAAYAVVVGVFITCLTAFIEFMRS